jgi:tetratricopeptide (TPR) repeat protein/tRNA A-37 threonylcarbamoyl transferase component Bud32
MTDRWERLTDLYHAAVALPADERAVLLAEECADDAALQADVERMIAAHDRASEKADAAEAPVAKGRTTSPPAPAIDRFGPYRVLREIGGGPTSTVYLASRDDGRFDQRVAIKLIEGEMDPNLALERLRSAHQTLSSRDHANIARLIDTGTTEDGRPYAVLEYVEGEPIDAYADGRRLSIPERLQLFVQLCNAVSYAHRRRVFHGDLKPANILVTAGGVPKLLDFGSVTPQETPDADIYALGSVLEALLGGGSSHGTRRPLRGDLDTIALRALTTSGDRRYDSVDQLADDIRRYQGSASTRTRPDAVRETQSTARRRRPSAFVAWTLAAGAVIALGMEVAPLLTERVAPAPAPVPADAPTTRERVLVFDLSDHGGDPALAAALSDALRAGLAESPSVEILSSRRPGVKTFVTGSIDTAAAGFSISVHLTRGPKSDRPEPIAETATDSADVMRVLGRVAERLREQLGESPSSIAGTPRLEEVTTASLPALRAYASGVRASNNGDRAGAIRMLKTAVAIDTGFASAHRVMAAAYGDLGDRQRAADALDHALANQTRIPFYERNHTIGSQAGFALGNYASAVDAYNRILERYPDDLRALSNLGAVHAARREYAVQESLLVRAIAVDSGVASLYTGLALADVNQGKYEAARRVLEKAERRFPGMRGSKLAAISLAASRQDWEAAEREARSRMTQAPDDSTDALEGLETLANIVMTQGRLGEAEQSFRRVIASGGRGGSPRRGLAAALRIAYLDLRYRHAPATAVATMNSALARFPLAKMDESERPYDEIARLYADAGQPKRARELLTQASKTSLGRQRGADANRRWTAGAIAMAEGRAWEGEIEIHGAAEAHPCPVCALPDLARAYEVAGKPDSAIAMYERYLHAPWQRRYETDGLELGFAMKRLGELYQQRNDRAKAAAQYTALLQLWRGADAELEPLIADVRRRLEQTGAATANR